MVAEYTVLSIDVLPACEVGRRHIAKASLLRAGGAAGMPGMARLLEMKSRGDTFVVGPPDAAEGQTPTRFVMCACGAGYVLEPDGVVEEYPARG
jgi:hypothetical protein